MHIFNIRNLLTTRATLLPRLENALKKIKAELMMFNFHKVWHTLTSTTTVLSFLPSRPLVVDEFSTFCKIFSNNTAPLVEFHVPI